VLSCGGLVWQQCQTGQPVAVWTICAGDPPPQTLSAFAESLHARWQTGREAVKERRAENEAACRLLGASCRDFPIPDCIYRRSAPVGEALYTSEEALFGLLHPAEETLVSDLGRTLAQTLPAGTQVVCPMALGGHVDHRLTRAAAEASGVPLWYYADYPYVLTDPLASSRQVGWETTPFLVSHAALCAWQDAVAAYASQISTFWADGASMRSALQDYYRQEGGCHVWRPEVSLNRSIS
jgi:LmbE family N-acetylglucosaminyl deacetylase